MNMCDIEKFSSQQENDFNAFKRKQKKDFFDFLQDKIDNLYEPKLKEMLFRFFERCHSENSNVRILKNIKNIKQEQMCRRVKEILEKDKYLPLFRELVKNLDQDAILMINHFHKEDYNLQSEYFIGYDDFQMVFDYLEQDQTFQILKEHSDFFTNTDTQFYIFRNKKDSIFLNLFKQFSIDSF
jgi:hypothetical protein